MFISKHFKRLAVCIILLITLLVSLTGCSKPADDQSADPNEGGGDEKVLIRVAINTTITHPEGIIITEFKRLLEEKAGDLFTVELYPAQQLGNAVKMLEGVQAGTIQVHMAPTAFYGSVAPAAQLIDLPYMFDSNVQAFNLLNSEDGESLNQYLYNRGFVPFGYFIMDYRTILSTFPIDSVESLHGKKIRTLQAEVSQQEIDAFGGTGVPVDTGEVYTAIQQGMVDGISSDVLFFVSNKLYEVAKYHSNMNHGIFMCCMTASKKWFEALPEEHQNIIRDTIDELVPWAYEEITTLAKENLEFLKEEGLTFVETPPEVIEEFKKGSVTVHENFLKKEGEEVSQVYNAIKEAMDRHK